MIKTFWFRFWPFLILLAAVVIFFYPVFLKGFIPLPADFVVGVYYPWLDYKWAGYGAGVPVKNPITTDVVSFIFPMQMYAVDLLKQGVVSLWNPLILTGSPLLANFQSAPFSPTNIVYWLLPKLDAWSLQIMLQPFLGATFLYLLLREFGRSKLSSILGGLIFAFGGFMLIWLQWNGHSLVAAFFPLIFYLSLKWLKSANLLWGVAISIALALQMFSGYPQIILYQFLGLAALVLIFSGNPLRSWKRIIGLGVFVVLGVALSAVQILPGAELLTYSQRKVELVLNQWAFLPWQHVITFVAPDYFGNHATYNYWGPADYTLTTGFTGVVAFMLAGLGVQIFIKERAVKFAISLVAIGLVIAFPTPISILIKESNLLGSQAASQHRVLVLLNLGIAILAAFGLDGVLENRMNLLKLQRSLYIPTIILSSFVVGSLVSFYILLGQAAAANMLVGIKNLILPLIFLGLSTVILMGTVMYKRYSKQLVILLILLSIFELFKFGWKFTPFSPKDFVYPNTPVLEFLQKQEKPFRVAAEDSVPINMMMPYGIETFEGYDAVYPLRIARYLAVSNSGQLDSDVMGRYGSVNTIDSNLFNISNSKYILALKRDKSGKADSDGTLPEKFQKPFLKNVFEDKTVVVLENLNALPRAKMFYDYEYRNEDLVLKYLIDKNYPINEKLIIESDLGLKFENGSSDVTYKESANKKTISVMSDKAGLLFIADSWFPGWVAKVNGKETNILNADYNFMAVEVGSGASMVELEYKPSSFEKGKMVSYISGGIILIILIFSRIKKYVTRS
jgi:hypothetical protein